MLARFVRHEATLESSRAKQNGLVLRCFASIVKATKPRFKSSERIDRTNADKFSERRVELADAALHTLADLGYARTSLREIAQNTEFSHGVLHYYFKDKFDLITFCVRQYKAHCVLRYDEIVANAKTADQLKKGFAAGMAQTLVDEQTLHRLWYDLRTQSLFEPSLRKDVAEIDHSLERMIWRIVSEHARLSGEKPRVSPALAYAIFDGLFQQSLLKLLHGDDSAPKELATRVRVALGELTLPVAKSSQKQPQKRARANA
jgi:AcrR family transcriptional regulator